MGLGNVVFATVGVGLVWLSYLLRGKPKDGSFVRDNKPTTLAERGAYLPLVIGRRRVGPIFAWAGSRIVRTEGASSGKGGGPSSPGQKIYYEAGWHLLCVGPARKLLKIYDQGKNILTNAAGTPIVLDSTTHPSGTTITLPNNRGSFQIYWGEDGQGINTYLGDASRLDIESRWPFICYVLWNRKRLGTSANWPLLDYEIEVVGGHSPLASNAWLDSNGTSGVNPAHAVYQLLTATYPHGAGLDHELIDKPSLEAFGALCQSEHLPLNMAIQDGADALKTLAAILQDTGCMTAMVGSKLMFMPVRTETGDIPVFDDDTLLIEQSEITTPCGPKKSSRVMFTYLDASQNYRQMDIAADDDGQYVGQPKTKQAEIVIATDRTTAGKIVDRRSQEEFGSMASLTLRATRGARDLLPGHVIFVNDYGRLRITSKKLDPMSSQVTLECLQDTYGIDATGQTAAPPVVSTGELTAEEDIAFDFVETTPVGASAASITVFRIRAHDQVVGSMIWASLDGSSYQLVGNQDDYASGGATTTAMSQGHYTLTGITVATKTFAVVGDASYLAAGDKILVTGTTEALQNGETFTVVSAVFDNPNSTVIVSETVPGANSTGGTLVQTVIENGPTISSDNDDILDVQDLSGDEPLWQAGKQICLIGTEVFYLRNVDPVGGDNYRLCGMIRAQRGSLAASHSIGSQSYIIDPDRLVSLSSAVVAAGSLSVKSVPFGTFSTVDISDVTAATHTVSGP